LLSQVIFVLQYKASNGLCNKTFPADRTTLGYVVLWSVCNI